MHGIQISTDARLESPCFSIVFQVSLEPQYSHVITNVNNVNINNVQNFEGAVRGTPDCAPVTATIMLGPSSTEDDGARIVAAFDPCILTDGT